MRTISLPAAVLRDSCCGQDFRLCLRTLATCVSLFAISLSANSYLYLKTSLLRAILDAAILKHRILQLQTIQVITRSFNVRFTRAVKFLAARLVLSSRRETLVKECFWRMGSSVQHSFGRPRNSFLIRMVSRSCKQLLSKANVRIEAPCDVKHTHYIFHKPGLHKSNEVFN